MSNRKYKLDPASEQKKYWPIIGLALFAAYKLFSGTPSEPAKQASQTAQTQQVHQAAPQTQQAAPQAPAPTVNGIPEALTKVPATPAEMFERSQAIQQEMNRRAVRQQEMQKVHEQLKNQYDEHHAQNAARYGWDQ